MPPSEPVDQPNAEIGYTSVDEQPDAGLLLDVMRATARWPAVRQLRAWERSRLALRPGERVLDVGCGLGDVAVVLAADVGPTGSVVAIDASDAMLSVARAQAAGSSLPVQFEVGDAQALPLEDGSVDACRSERTLQWIPDERAALAEMVRVLRPGGRLCAIETDWRTLVFDLPDRDATSALVDAFAALRGPGLDVGGRLLNLVRDLGLERVQVTGAAHVWTHWDPDTEVAPPGLFPIRPVVDQLVQFGHLAAPMAERFVAGLERAAHRDRLCASLSMFAVYGHRP